ncbi:MAG: hypothetical protein ABFE01_29625 [Phycisphaerales bacterium]
MIAEQKAHWTSYGSAVFSTLFFVFCAFFIVDMLFDLQVSKLDRYGREQGLPWHIAPENLEGVPEMFRLSLRVESPGFPTEEMTKTEAWRELQSTVTGYTRRLTLMESQETQRTSWTMRLYVFSAFGMLVFTIANRRNNHDETDGKKELGTNPTISV